MKVNYDKESDTLTIIFSDTQVEESDEKKEGVILDYNKDGRIVSMEILDASKYMTNPNTVEFNVANQATKY
jgi:uncharacterized protein YuzE